MNVLIYPALCSNSAAAAAVVSAVVPAAAAAAGEKDYEDQDDPAAVSVSKHFLRPFLRTIRRFTRYF